MTDLEMTKICADAMGVEVVPSTSVDGGWATVLNQNCGDFYDPLHDDAQAMALLKKFRLWVHCEEHHSNGTKPWCVQDADTEEYFVNDDLNRAIVECVVKSFAASRSE